MATNPYSRDDPQFDEWNAQNKSALTSTDAQGRKILGTAAPSAPTANPSPALPVAAPSAPSAAPMSTPSASKAPSPPMQAPTPDPLAFQPLPVSGGPVATAPAIAPPTGGAGGVEANPNTTPIYNVAGSPGGAQDVWDTVGAAGAKAAQLKGESYAKTHNIVNNPLSPGFGYQDTGDEAANTARLTAQYDQTPVREAEAAQADYERLLAQAQGSATPLTVAAPTEPPRYLQNGLETDAQGNPVHGGYNALSDLIRQSGAAPGVVTPVMQEALKQNPALAGALSASDAATYGPTLNGMGYDVTSRGATGYQPPGISVTTQPAGPTKPGLPTTVPASPAGPATPTGPNGVPPVTPPAPPAGPSGPSGPSGSSGPATPPVTPPTSPPATAGGPLNGLPASSGALSAVTLTPTSPENALTNSTITPGPATDRFQIAKDKLADWDAIEQPKFDRNIRDLSQNAAARGQIGSGMVRGSFRDALNDFDTRRQTTQRGYLTDALTGSIDDAYKNIGIAQQQQQFQSGQQQISFGQNMQLQQLADSEQGQQFQQLMAATGFNAQQIQQAFENAYRVQQLSDDETGQAFYRALQQYIQGTSGDPSQYLLYLAGQYAKPTGSR